MPDAQLARQLNCSVRAVCYRLSPVIASAAMAFNSVSVIDNALRLKKRGCEDIEPVHFG